MSFDSLSIGAIVFYSVTPGVITAVIAAILLLVASALMSGSEVAFFSLTPADLEKLKDSEKRGAEKALSLLKKPEKLLATLLIANNFVNVGIVILSTYITAALINFQGSQILGFVLQVVVVTFVILFFGEIAPKVYATQSRVKFVVSVAFIIAFVEKLFYPLSSLLIKSSFIFNRQLAKKRDHISIDELSQALELTTDTSEEEKEILEGIVNFGNTDVKEIMKSRVDVVAVDISTDFDTLLKIISDSGYSRIPVFEDTFDNIKGVLYIKDLLQYIGREKDFKWPGLVRASFFVPETKKINDLLQEFRQKKIHLAVVIDEYGGASGIVTLEDILEEIVGEISDETDKDQIDFVEVDPNNFIFEGKVLLNDVCRIIDVDDDIFDEVKGDSETLAGLLLEIKGEIPKRSEKIEVGKFLFTVISSDQRRIKKIKLTIRRS